MICPKCGIEFTSDKIFWIHVEQCMEEPEIIETKEGIPEEPAKEEVSAVPQNIFGGNLFNSAT